MKEYKIYAAATTGVQLTDLGISVERLHELETHIMESVVKNRSMKPSQLLAYVTETFSRSAGESHLMADIIETSKYSNNGSRFVYGITQTLRDHFFSQSVEKELSTDWNEM